MIKIRIESKLKSKGKIIFYDTHMCIRKILEHIEF